MTTTTAPRMKRATRKPKVKTAGAKTAAKAVGKKGKAVGKKGMMKGALKTGLKVLDKVAARAVPGVGIPMMAKDIFKFANKQAGGKKKSKGGQMARGRKRK